MTTTLNIVITGANRGIGLALTHRLLEEGNVIWATHRPKADLSALGALQQRYPQLTLVPLDVRDASQCQALSHLIGDQHLDVLWNNAGVLDRYDSTVDDLDISQFAEILDVNTLGPIRVMQALMPQLRRSAAAKVLSLSSVMASMTVGGKGAHAYRTSKAALNRTLRVFAEELKSENMTVMCLHPGWVKTDMGGKSADISVDTSARGLIAVMHRCTLQDTGAFWDYRGQELPW